MEVLNLFPTEVFVFKNLTIDNSNLIINLEKFADQVKQSSNISYIRNIHDKQETKELFDWCKNCLEEIRLKNRYDCDQFEITSSWFNRALPNSGMCQNYHRHSLSFFSAVYYLTDGSPTVFEDPVIHRTQAQLEVLRKDFNPYEYIQPEPGKLVVFPSWLYHTSLPHVTGKDRYIISFNTLPTGYVNYNVATDSVAHITLETKEKKYD
jgi:uncharacterized protein (TIGR02466 family)